MCPGAPSFHHRGQCTVSCLAHQLHLSCTYYVSFSRTQQVFLPYSTMVFKPQCCHLMVATCMAEFYDYNIPGTNCLTHPRVPPTVFALIVYLVDKYGMAKLNNIKNYYVHISVPVSLCICVGEGWRSVCKHAHVLGASSTLKQPSQDSYIVLPGLHWLSEAQAIPILFTTRTLGPGNV